MYYQVRATCHDDYNGDWGYYSGIYNDYEDAEDEKEYVKQNYPWTAVWIVETEEEIY